MFKHGSKLRNQVLVAQNNSELSSQHFLAQASLVNWHLKVFCCCYLGTYSAPKTSFSLEAPPKPPPPKTNQMKKKNKNKKPHKPHKKTHPKTNKPQSNPPHAVEKVNPHFTVFPPSYPRVHFCPWSLLPAAVNEAWDEFVCFSETCNSLGRAG